MFKAVLVCLLLCFVSLSHGSGTNDLTRQWVVYEYYNNAPCNANNTNLQNTIVYPVNLCRNNSGVYFSKYTVSNGVITELMCYDPLCQQSCSSYTVTQKQCYALNYKKQDDLRRRENENIMQLAQSLREGEGEREGRRKSVRSTEYQSVYLSTGLPYYVGDAQVDIHYPGNASPPCNNNTIDFLFIDLPCYYQTKCSISSTLSSQYQFTCGFPSFSNSNSASSTSYSYSSYSYASTSVSSSSASSASSSGSSNSIGTNSGTSTYSPFYILDVTILMSMNGPLTLLSFDDLDNAFQITLDTPGVMITIVSSSGTYFQLQVNASVVLPATTPSSTLAEYSSVSLTSSIQSALTDPTTPLGSATTGFSVSYVSATTILVQTPSATAATVSTTTGTSNSASSMVVSISLILIAMCAIML